jgi:hypothetical protein
MNSQLTLCRVTRVKDKRIQKLIEATRTGEDLIAALNNDYVYETVEYALDDDGNNSGARRALDSHSNSQMIY